MLSKQNWKINRKLKWSNHEIDLWSVSEMGNECEANEDEGGKKNHMNINKSNTIII